MRRLLLCVFVVLLALTQIASTQSRLHFNFLTAVPPGPPDPPPDPPDPPVEAPTLTSITPNQGVQGGTISVTLAGTHFISGATSVAVSGTGVSVNTIIVITDTSLTANFVITGGATLSARDVTVTTASGTSSAQTFTVIVAPSNPVPSLTTISPTLGVRTNAVPVTLTGTDFVIGSTAVNVTGSGIVVTGIVVANSTSLAATFTIDAAATLGAHTVTVTTASGTSNGQSFTVNPLPPTLTTVSPSSAAQGTTTAVTLVGTNFIAGGTTVTISGTQVTANSVSVTSSTSLTVSFVIGSTATVGARAVTVTTNGGTCSPQTFTVTAAPPPPPGTTLVQSGDLTLVGSFRVPVNSGVQSYNYGGESLTYNAAGNGGLGSLYLAGVSTNHAYGEISIPTPLISGTIAGLNTATNVQVPAVLVSQANLNLVDGAAGIQVVPGGLAISGSNLIASVWKYYDGAQLAATKSHFKISLAGLSAATAFASVAADQTRVTGPFQVGTGLASFGTDTYHIAGLVGLYMATIPSAWQTALGGTHLTGMGGRISVLQRTSAGPAASAFTPTDLGVIVPAPVGGVRPLIAYPAGGGFNHPTLGVWGINTTPVSLYNGTQGFRGMIFPNGTDSVLFFGWGSNHFCYGCATSNPAAEGTTDAGCPGQIYCYDLSNTGGKTHGYPSFYVVYAYDAHDLLAVKNGTKSPWDIVPYATWTLTMPFESSGHDVGGAAYDPVNKLFYISAQYSDGLRPLIHVFSCSICT